MSLSGPGTPSYQRNAAKGLERTKVHLCRLLGEETMLWPLGIRGPLVVIALQIVLLCSAQVRQFVLNVSFFLSLSLSLSPFLQIEETVVQVGVNGRNEVAAD